MESASSIADIPESESLVHISATSNSENNIDTGVKTALLELFNKIFTKAIFDSDTYLQNHLNSMQLLPLEALYNAPSVAQITSNREVINLALSECKVVLLMDEGVRPNVRPEQNTLILRDIPSSASGDDIVASLFVASGTPAVLSVRADMNDTWFISFASEAHAREALDAIRNCKFDGKPVKARLKTESLSKAYYSGSGVKDYYSNAVAASTQTAALSQQPPPSLGQQELPSQAQVPAELVAPASTPTSTLSSVSSASPSPVTVSSTQAGAAAAAPSSSPSTAAGGVFFSTYPGPPPYMATLSPSGQPIPMVGYPSPMGMGSGPKQMQMPMQWGPVPMDMQQMAQISGSHHLPAGMQLMPMMMSAPQLQMGQMGGMYAPQLMQPQHSSSGMIMAPVIMGGSMGVQGLGSGGQSHPNSHKRHQGQGRGSNANMRSGQYVNSMSRQHYGYGYQPGPGQGRFNQQHLLSRPDVQYDQRLLNMQGGYQTSQFVQGYASQSPPTLPGAPYSNPNYPQISGNEGRVPQRYQDSNYRQPHPGVVSGSGRRIDRSGDKVHLVYATSAYAESITSSTLDSDDKEISDAFDQQLSVAVNNGSNSNEAAGIPFTTGMPSSSGGEGGGPPPGSMGPGDSDADPQNLSRAAGIRNDATAEQEKAGRGEGVGVGKNVSGSGGAGEESFSKSRDRDRGDRRPANSRSGSGRGDRHKRGEIKAGAVDSKNTKSTQSGAPEYNLKSDFPSLGGAVAAGDETSVLPSTKAIAVGYAAALRGPGSYIASTAAPASPAVPAAQDISAPQVATVAAAPERDAGGPPSSIADTTSTKSLTISAVEKAPPTSPARDKSPSSVVSDSRKAEGNVMITFGAFNSPVVASSDERPLLFGGGEPTSPPRRTSSAVSVLTEAVTTRVFREASSSDSKQIEAPPAPPKGPTSPQGKTAATTTTTTTTTSAATASQAAPAVAPVQSVVTESAAAAPMTEVPAKGATAWGNAKRSFVDVLRTPK